MTDPAAQPATPARPAREADPPRGLESGSEPLAALICRRISLAYYRRSECYARHRGRVGPENALPVPSFGDVLAVYLAQRLPAWAVAGLGSDGLQRLAHGCARVAKCGKPFALAVYVIARAGWRTLSWLRQHTPRFRRLEPAAAAAFVKGAPSAGPRVLLGGRVLLHGGTYAENRLCCYFQRCACVPHACQIFVHLHPAGVPVRQPDEAGTGASYLYKDHDPVCPVPDWPRRRIYRDEISLADLPAGDYRVEIGLIDVVARERLICEETGRLAVDLGWVRVTAAVAETATPSAAPQSEDAVYAPA